MAAPDLADDIRDYLVTTFGLSNVSVNVLQPSPINQYAVVEYAGPQNIKTHAGASPVAAVLDEGMIQIMARHTSANTARANILAVIDELDGRCDTTIGSVVYTYMECISRPRVIDREESGSTTFIAEFKVQSRR